MKTLVAWLGNSDIEGSQKSEESFHGPIAQALRNGVFDQLLLLCTQSRGVVGDYVGWLAGWTNIEVVTVMAELEDPTDFRAIYLAATGAIDGYIVGGKPRLEMTFHLSPGTPAMAAIWILLSSTRYESKLIQTSRERGVKFADIPFEISAEFVPKVMEAADESLRSSIIELPNSGAKFGDILFRSNTMHDVVRRAQKAAIRNIPIVIEGESGTGKELFARAIHNTSRRSGNSFVAINCGAIPKELVESVLFGSARGAYTGAIERSGYFEDTDNGTLFLDEIGELPLEAQVKLLRALQEGVISRVGETRERKFNVRIVAATNRDLGQAVTTGIFREDLYYRLLGILLRLLPLREREGDVGFLADMLLEKINDEVIDEEPEYRRKTLSAAARNILINHSWPGNVRELLSTLRRAAIWSENAVLTRQDIEAALLPILQTHQETDQVMNQKLGEGFNLIQLQESIIKHYLARALKEAGGNKSKVARLLGLSNYQTVSNWMQRYGVANS